MPEVTKEAVLARLAGIRGPDDDRDIVRRGMVSDIVIANGRVMFSVTVPAERAAAYEPMRLAAETTIKTIPGVVGAMVVLTAEKRGGSGGASPPRPGSAPAPAPSHEHGPRPSHGRSEPAAAPGSRKAGIPGVNAIVA